MSEEYINIVVSEPQKVEEGSLSAVTSYVTYKVSTETNRSGMSYSSVSVVRRFSDFVWLSEMLTLTNSGAIIPALPDKSIVSKFGTDFIESRKRSLERFLHRIAAHPDLSVTDHFLVFLQADEAGLKQAISLSKTLKPTATKAAKDLAKSTWSLYIGKQGKTANVERTAEDVQVDEILTYILELEKIMNKVSAAASSIVERSKKMAYSYHEFGSSVSNLGLCEGEEFGDTLSRFGETMDELSNTINEHASAEEMRFQEPLDEYARLVQSVKSAIAVRNEKRGAYVTALTNLEVDQASYSKVIGQAGKESEAMKKEHAVEKSQTAADTAKVEYEDVTKRLIRDFEQFKRTKTGDIKEILLNFVNLQIEYEKSSADGWAKLGPIANSIDAQTSPGIPNEYVENPNRPVEALPVADADDNPFAGESAEV
jgi:predicted RNA-binding protein YlqC (UPF0109 family)